MESSASHITEPISPLADQMRPRDFKDFAGQEHILAEGRLLRRSIEADRLPSMILWGPPGCGKTSLAKIIANKTGSNFLTLSAVSSNKAEAKAVIETAKQHLIEDGSKTILFVDEIHRFNKAQQDIFLPYIENGTITFIGATTENPSFEVNAPLLSRARVFHLREISEEQISLLLARAVKKINDGKINLGGLKKIAKISINKEALAHISKLSEGDARDAYNALELAIFSTKPLNNSINIDLKVAEDAIQEKFIRYDKSNDGHFDAISALHKSIRASDVNAALHYLCRMLQAGEDPLYIIRRLIRFASEDIGLADPQALVQAVATQQATHFVGMPEAGVIIAQCVIYLSLAPKSRSTNDAYDKANSDVLNKRLDPIPLKIRNAPTKLMKEFGFGKGYQMYDRESHLPENLLGQEYWSK